MMDGIEREREKLDQQADKENKRWDTIREKLEDEVDRARKLSGMHKAKRPDGFEPPDLF